MARSDTIGVRLDPQEREALQRAADADDRSMSALARKLLVEWLREKGWIYQIREPDGSKSKFTDEQVLALEHLPPSMGAKQLGMSQAGYSKRLAQAVRRRAEGTKNDG